MKDLPSTIADAVELCGSLEICYLWVDALCILQDDDSPEWSEEAGNIDKIYGFATFTLAISSSADSNQGFLENTLMQTQRVPNPSATIAHHLIELAPKTLPQAKKTCPLDLRGWAFQEERLSPRVIHWTAHGVFWTCLSGSCSEFDADFKPDKPGASSSYFKDFTRPYYQDHGEGIERVLHTDRIWSRLIEAYSTRQFTQIHDRLPALSGLARKYANETGDVYIGGHWANALHSDLLWVSGQGDGRNKSESAMTRLAIAPSWSWVSVPPAAGVVFPRRYGRPAFELGGHGIDKSSRARYSAVLSAEFTLKARLRPLLREETEIDWPVRELEDESGHPIFPDARGSIYSLQPETGRILLSYNAVYPIVIKTDYGIPANLDQCFCLEISKNGFLLVRPVPQSGQYLRVGCASWHEDRRFFEGSDTVSVELI